MPGLRLLCEPRGWPSLTGDRAGSASKPRLPSSALPLAQKLTDDVFSSCLKSRDYMQAKNALLALNRCVKVRRRRLASTRLAAAGQRSGAPQSAYFPCAACTACALLVVMRAGKSGTA